MNDNSDIPGYNERKAAAEPWQFPPFVDPQQNEYTDTERMTTPRTAAGQALLAHWFTFDGQASHEASRGILAIEAEARAAALDPETLAEALQLFRLYRRRPHMSSDEPMSSEDAAAVIIDALRERSGE